jgi:pyruvate/2-oxoglutarate dehydrogenase complex dihydrolipoamide dehydrogenase (E3) component
MAKVEKCDDLIIGSGIAGKFTAWTRDSRRRSVIVERGLLGGACPNVACLPRADGSDANCDARSLALHGVARRNPDPSDNVRRAQPVSS